MSLSVLQARRIALAAQGFTRARPQTQIGPAHVGRVIDRLGFFQIDSVNVLARAHYMPLFSRLGAYDRELLHRAAGRKPRKLVEYWAHEAAFVDVRLWPAFRFRMDSTVRMWGSMRRIAEEKPDFVRWVLGEVRDRGPVTARDIEHDIPRVKDDWGWNWSEVKQALEYLFYTGQVTAARRNTAFERLYDLPERVVPESVFNAEPPTEAEAHRQLVEHAARALGVATPQCLRDYFRLQPEPTKLAIEVLVDEGVITPTKIDRWNRPAFIHHEAARPRKVAARALLSPFDPLVFERTRTEKLFDFRYRIEIYVPAEQRVHGYYVLPFLLGDRLVGRVDLKAARAESTLIVHGAWAEPNAPDVTAEELADELRLLADWLDLEAIRPPVKGDLAGELTAAMGRHLN